MVRRWRTAGGHGHSEMMESTLKGVHIHITESFLDGGYSGMESLRDGGT